MLALERRSSLHPSEGRVKEGVPTAMKCPRCAHEFAPPEGVTEGVTRSGIYSPDQERSDRNSYPTSSLLSVTRARVRGPNKEYSGAFEAAWKHYGRKQEKEESFFRWRIVAPSVGGEETLLRLCLGAFLWQSREWGQEGWKFAPYFHRYLKKRKWEDEPPPAPVVVRPLRARDDLATKAVDRKVAEFRATPELTPEQLADIRAVRGGK